jgi:hypothetical protein
LLEGWYAHFRAPWRSISEANSAASHKYVSWVSPVALGDEGGFDQVEEASSADANAEFEAKMAEDDHRPNLPAKVLMIWNM